MLSDSLEARILDLSLPSNFLNHGRLQAVRPKFVMLKTFEEAATAVDEMFNTAFQNAGCEYAPSVMCLALIYQSNDW